MSRLCGAGLATVARLPLSTCARMASTARGTRCSRSACRIVDSSLGPASWGLGAQAGWCWSPPSTASEAGAVVVGSCAGRTRGILGAASLLTAGIQNPVMSLEGGTQGWRLAGLDLEHGMATALSPASPGAVAAAQQRAAAVAARYG